MSSTKTRKLTVVRKPNGPIRLEEGEAVHVGVDVHKASYSVALFSDRRGVITTWVQPARPEVLLERLRPLREGVAQVVYEAGPTGYALARRLRAEGFECQVIAPSKLLAPVGPEAKSDRLDCRRLAHLSAEGLLHPVRVPTEQEEADRQVLRLRELLVRKTHAVQSQIKSFLLQHGVDEPAGLCHWSKKSLAALRGLALLPELRFCLDLLLDELAHAQEQVRCVTVRLKGLAEVERHREAVAVMSSVPGVGVLTAAAFRLELPEPERFDHSVSLTRSTATSVTSYGILPPRGTGPTRREGKKRTLRRRASSSSTSPRRADPPMLIVHVHVQVKPDQVEAFKAACAENSRNSLQEPGVARFDVLQQQEDHTRFLLVEVYRSAEAPAAHKQTAHYQAWAAAVADMMAVPRSSVKYDKVYPEVGLS
jgi:transposase/quinol monooxygenase YgiN